MNLELNIQNPAQYTHVPSNDQFEKWAKTTLTQHKKNAELTIRIVDEHESAYLNEAFRHKAKPTNVLAFPFEPLSKDEKHILGDIVICASFVKKEAKAQHKEELAHWAHLTVHGILHLLGYNHIKKSDAKIMENLEIEILEKLGFKNPYKEE